MKIGNVDTDKEVLLIAEIGVNHEGDENAAAEMIRRAAASGAGAVKLQTFKVGNYVSPAYGEARLARLNKFALPYAAFERLARVAEKEKVPFLSTPLDLESARFLDGIVPAFKIASGDNDFYPLLRFAASTGKPLLLSAGLADMEILRRAKQAIEAEWKKKGTAGQLAVLHCVSSYPVPDDQANLASIAYLKKELGCTAGYSDHTLGCDAALMAVALGARIIEKHFTLDKNYSEFRDHQLSATPDELRTLAGNIRGLSAKKEGAYGVR